MGEVVKESLFWAMYLSTLIFHPSSNPTYSGVWWTRSNLLAKKSTLSCAVLARFPNSSVIFFVTLAGFSFWPVIFLILSKYFFGFFSFIKSLQAFSCCLFSSSFCAFFILLPILLISLWILCVSGQSCLHEAALFCRLSFLFCFIILRIAGLIGFLFTFFRLSGHAIS